MYEQREKPKEKIKTNRPATRLNVTNKTHKLGRIDDDFSAQQSNGLLQRQPRGRVNPMVADYFQPQSSMIQRMAVGLPAAQMLALASRLVAGLAGGMTLSNSLQALNKSPEFERMTGVQKMMVYSVLYKVANQAKPNKTETLPAAFDAHSTTGGSEITEQGATSTSQPLTDQAILDLLGPIPASDDMTLVGNTPLPIVDDLGLGRVYSQGGRNESVSKAESKALDGSAGTVVSSSAQEASGNASKTGSGSVVPNSGLMDGLTELDPRMIRTTQTTTKQQGATLRALTESMKTNGFKVEADKLIDVVRMPDGELTSLDNTRIVAADLAGVKIQARVHNFDDLLPNDEQFISRFIGRKGEVPTNWGEAVQNRISNQSSLYRNTNPQGAPFISYGKNY